MLFHTTHVLDRIRAPLIGGTCFKQFCTWFIDIASKSAVCKHFTSLENVELYHGLIGKDERKNLARWPALSPS